MVDDKTQVTIRNLTGRIISYTIPESNTKRKFAGFASKPVSARELRDLYYTQGGATLLTEYLAIDNQELAEEFGVNEDLFTHEYSWTAQDIDRVLLQDDIDVLKDAMDFAPIGIQDTLLVRAIELEIPDMNKRNYLQKVTGRDITKMINYAHELKNISEVDNSPAPSHRRRVGNDKQNTSRRRAG